jgi:peflin
VCPSPSRIGNLTVRAQSWERVFQRFDTNNSNTIDGDELQQALKELGYELSPPLQDLLKRKYGAGLSFEHPMSSAHCSRLFNLDVNWDYEEAAAEAGPAVALPAGPAVTPPAGPATAPPTGAAAGTIPSSGITFDRFMRACVVVKQLKESFEALDRDSYGRVKIDYDTFLRMVFKLP